MASGEIDQEELAMRKRITEVGIENGILNRILQYSPESNRRIGNVKEIV